MKKIWSTSATLIFSLFLVSQVLAASIDTTTIGIETTSQDEQAENTRVDELISDKTGSVNSTFSKSQINANDSSSDLIKESLEVQTSLDGENFSVDSVKFSAAEGKGGCRPTDLCREVYRKMRDNLPNEAVEVISAITILPPITYRVVFDLAIAGSGVYMEAFVACWQCNVQHSFGLDPTAAAARIQGDIKGDLFFAQTLAKQDKPSSLAVVGTFSGLTPAQRYRVTIHKSGDIDSKCSYVGEQFSTLGGAFFTADKDGKAVLLMQDTSVLIEGEVSLLGRSVVVTPDNDSTKMSCGVVSRNIIPTERLRA